MCQYLKPSTADGFKWACSLREAASDWLNVYRMPEYRDNVKPKLDAAGYVDIDCGEWPPKGVKCNDCGEVG